MFAGSSVSYRQKQSFSDLPSASRRWMVQFWRGFGRLRRQRQFPIPLNPAAARRRSLAARPALHLIYMEKEEMSLE